MSDSTTVRDKIRAWQTKRATEEAGASIGLTENLCDRVLKDLRRYVGWRYEPVAADDADKLLELAFALDDMARTCRVMARGAEYEFRRQTEKAKTANTS